MDDIQDHWNDVRESLRKEIERSLVKKLSEARYTYGSWNKQFKDEDKFNDEDKTMWLMITECPRAMLLQLLSLVFAIIVSLLIFVPVFVLIFHYDLVHYEEQLWSECFMYLGIFALAQIVFAFLAAPYTGWGMIKESSRDADLGVTLRGSMHMQGLVSTFLFATIMGRLQVSLRFDLTNNVTEVSSFDTPSIVHIIGTPDTDAFDYTFAEHALKQWYQGLVVLAVTQSALATIITIICRTHIEPLNSKAAIAFAIKNFRYFGLPMQLILLAFVNTILALILWIFGTHGLFAGLFASCALGIGMGGILLASHSVFSWKNEELSEKVRNKRETLRKKIWKTLIPFNVLYWSAMRCFVIFKYVCCPSSSMSQNACKLKKSSPGDSEPVGNQPVCPSSKKAQNACPPEASSSGDSEQP